MPLSDTAMQAMQEWRARFPDAQPGHYVFPSERYALFGKKGEFGGRVQPCETFPDRPIGSWKTAWKAAKKTAGVEARWHDLRHTAVSRVAAGGATDGTLQAIFGWISPTMIDRYSHVRNEAKRKAVSVLDEPKSRKRSPQKPPQGMRSPQRHSVQLIDFKWSGREDSNLRPPGPEPGALPGSATPRTCVWMNVHGRKAPGRFLSKRPANYLKVYQKGNGPGRQESAGSPYTGKGRSLARHADETGATARLDRLACARRSHGHRAGAKRLRPGRPLVVGTRAG